jgi:hypothetical protein
MPSVEKKRAAFRFSLVVFVATFLSTFAVAQYKRVDLVSDQPGAARHTDPNLKNGWFKLQPPRKASTAREPKMEILSKRRRR